MIDNIYKSMIRGELKDLKVICNNLNSNIEHEDYKVEHVLLVLKVLTSKIEVLMRVLKDDETNE